MRVPSIGITCIVCQEVAASRKEKPHAVCRMRDRPLGLCFQEWGPNRPWVAPVKSWGEKRQGKRRRNTSDVLNKDECK